MAHGKSVNIYLMDGTAGGRVKCTLANWTGVVYRIPRTMLKECADRRDLRQSGVYLLLGYDEAADRSIV